MSYLYYCLGLAAHSVNLASLLDDSLVTAYAIGSLDRLNNVRLPRCRREVEDAISALSDPNSHCGNNSSCAGFATTQPTVVDGDTFMRAKKDYIEAFGSDNYGMLREHMDAHTRRGDGSPDSDLATLLLFTTMKYRLANKTRP